MLYQLLPFITSLLLAFFTTPFVYRFFIKKHWVENPDIKQQKTGNATALYPVPRGGGLPIFIAVLMSSFLFLPKDPQLTSIIIAALITLIIGLIDDIKDISPIIRLIFNIITGIIIVASGIGIHYLSNPFGPPGTVFQFNYLFLNSINILSDILTIVWIVWCTNIVGWSAGIEGQLSGFVSISAIFIGILAYRFSADQTQWSVIILAMIVAGAYLGFLPHNFYPQKIMPGYSGKSLAGFFLAVLSILSGAKLATLIFLLGVPMVDAIFVILRRIKNHRPIYKSDGQHLHHLLLKIGLSRPQIAIIYWLFSFILGIISLFLNSRQKFYFFIGFIFLFFALILQLSRHTQPKSNH